MDKQRMTTKQLETLRRLGRLGTRGGGPSHLLPLPQVRSDGPLPAIRFESGRVLVDERGRSGGRPTMPTMDQLVQPKPVVVDVRSGKVILDDEDGERYPGHCFID